MLPPCLFSLLFRSFPKRILKICYMCSYGNSICWVMANPCWIIRSKTYLFLTIFLDRLVSIFNSLSLFVWFFVDRIGSAPWNSSIYTCSFLLFSFYSLETGLCCDLHQNGHKFLYQTRWIWCLSLRYSTSLSILFIDHESRNTSAFGHYHFFLDHYL